MLKSNKHSIFLLSATTSYQASILTIELHGICLYRIEHLLRDPYPTRPHLHAVDNDLTDAIRVFSNITHFDPQPTKACWRLTLIPRSQYPCHNVVVGQLSPNLPLFRTRARPGWIVRRKRRKKDKKKKRKRKRNCNREWRENVDGHVMEGGPLRIGVRSTVFKALRST